MIGRAGTGSDGFSLPSIDLLFHGRVFNFWSIGKCSIGILAVLGHAVTNSGGSCRGALHWAAAAGWEGGRKR